VPLIKFLSEAHSFYFFAVVHLYNLYAGIGKSDNLRVCVVMNDEILQRIQREYGDNYLFVKDQLETITLHHVMAQSQLNLDNTYKAILDLCNGDAQKVSQYVEVAKVDFRDVIYWAVIDKNNTRKTVGKNVL
jgi:hypothetical protein